MLTNLLTGSPDSGTGSRTLTGALTVE